MGMRGRRAPELHRERLIRSVHKGRKRRGKRGDRERRRREDPLIFSQEDFSISAIGVEVAVLEHDAAVDGLGVNGGSAGTDAGVEALPRIALNVDGKLPTPCQELPARAIRKAPSAARETGQDLQ